MSRQITTFFLGNTLFGVDILLVKEVYRHMTVNPIPNAPNHLLGLMNLRGRVVTVIDLNVCLNRLPETNTGDRRLLILKTREEIKKYINNNQLNDVFLGEDIVGFLIDKMDDVLTVENEEILPPPPNIADLDEDIIEGIIKQGKRLVILLDVTVVLELVMNAAVEAENQ
ncbi:chemotaxis protein CheW [Desulfonema magnum]|uniref:Chemotaxis protein CheW n=1 Tax=Desulfonema magnum TaxID=45655 RepID=A0A975BMU6_9BACT|nr:chemotaxis protein CheW [Desulfonema magnum]QTA88418.1 Chemotaxis protein CheW [Desulfonema magnum]